MYKIRITKLILKSTNRKEFNYLLTVEWLTTILLYLWNEPLFDNENEKIQPLETTWVKYPQIM
jgi:hypothetical protein